ncbi:radical SAM protein [Methylosinus sp. H3A]|uniref:radical SAM protein n=1 Tax=Methylosinus sp. H3A TaxID=2785786 RepID=UPI0018C31916|nr:radical SAM protein [Methylosinus sp. H3A]MBG0812131.1 radical SAM protein [Methylosinus sp. H3A]
MTSSLYIINPAADFPTYFGAEILLATGRRPGVMMADLSSTTVAALAPRDFSIEISDEGVAPVDFDHDADWIAITGKVSQRRRMIAIADEFRRRGKKVIIGGPYASLSPDHLREHCDVLVSGEMEEIAEEFFADLRAGRPRDRYIGDKPSLATSPVPRWDLYPNHRAMLGAVQTSRGCPFECEFCDVIQYLGRKQRHKPIANVLAELDALWAHGFRATFLADDNFTAYRAHCKELLAAMAHWRRDGHPMDFVTQISIDATRDTELMDMLVEAGVHQVFIGIETPNLESLRETGKRQNLKIDIVGEVQKLIDRGISVMGGMIVGFDHDGPDVFSQQYEFAMSTPIPIFSLGALMASEATPLFDRITREGRLLQGTVETQAVPWGSNIRPVTMSMEELNEGLHNLCNALYAPSAFGERMLNFIDAFGRARGPSDATIPDASSFREIEQEAVQIAADVRKLGGAEGRMWNKVWGAALRKPETVKIVARIMFQYAQARHMFDRGNYWEPQLAFAPPRREVLATAAVA